MLQILGACGLAICDAGSVRFITTSFIFQSIPDMANICFLLIIFTIGLSVVGVKLFGRFVPEYFGDPLKCMFSIFVCFTQASNNET